MDGASEFVTPRIGDPVPPKEDLRLLTCRGMFSDDVSLDGQAYAAVVRSPHAHAVIKAIETTDAMAVPGVLAVLTGTDALADGLKQIPRNVMPSLPDITMDRIILPRRNTCYRPIRPASLVKHSSW